MFTSRLLTRSGARAVAAATLALALGGQFAADDAASAHPAAPAPLLTAKLAANVTPNGAVGNLSFLVGGTTGKVSFEGINGQVVTVTTSSGTFTTNCDAQVSLAKPGGVVVAGPVCGGQAATIGSALTLTASGIYVVSVVAGPTATGSLKVKVTSTGAIKSMTPGASGLVVTSTTAGQSTKFGFVAKAGEHYTVLGTASTLPGCTSNNLQILNPNSTVLATIGGCLATNFLDQTVIPANGTYQVNLVALNGAGSIKVALAKIVDATGTIATDGTPKVFTVAGNKPGLNASYTFSGTTGQRISVNVTGGTFTGCDAVHISLFRPTGTTLAVVGTCSATAFIDAIALDATGTWTVFVDPLGATTGHATVAVYTVTDQTAALTLGTPVTFTSATPGKNFTGTFTGTTGQRISINATGGTFTGCDAYFVTLLRPNSTALAGTSTCSSAAFIDTITLDATGTWTVLVNPLGATTGQASVTAYNVVDQTGTITVGGAAKTVTSTTPGKNALFTWSGTSGQARTITVTGSTFTGCDALHVSAMRPNGTTLTFGGTCSGSLTVGPFTLDATGTWTILVDPLGSTTGTASVALT